VSQDSLGIFFVMNIAESIPLYYQKDTRSATAKEKTQPLSFREMPTCHSFNKGSASTSKLELLIGFGSGDLLLYEPLSKTSSVQFNKDVMPVLLSLFSLPPSSPTFSLSLCPLVLTR